MPQVNIRISEQDRRELAAEAAAQGTTVTDLLRQAWRNRQETIDLAARLEAMEGRLAARLAAMADEIERRAAERRAARQEGGAA
jgi:hypothetical protein